jgi:hypothetical protein
MLADLEQEHADLEKELAERLVIMRYFDIPSGEQWDMDKILAAADRKLAVCEQAKRMLEKEEDALQKEYVSLTQGKVLELPKELMALFGRLGIHVVYGMDWLRKNGYTAQKNEELVRRQPFLPYALILSKHDINTLAAHDREVCTSFPVPIILREHLEECMVSQDSGLSSAKMGRVLHRTVDLAGTEAPGADVHMLGSAVDDCLDPLHIGLPGPVGAAVRVGDLVAEHNALVAEFTFGHSLLPPRWSGFA